MSSSAQNLAWPAPTWRSAVLTFRDVRRYLEQNMDWLEEELGGYDDDYLIIDCPGQIELYTHHPFLPKLVRELSRLGLRTCAVYLLESQFMEDRYKFFRYVDVPPVR